VDLIPTDDEFSTCVQIIVVLTSSCPAASRGPDFLDRHTGDLIELTTGGQALTEGVKYGPGYALPDLENVAIYDLF